jgi:hypothetical protein
MNEAVSVGEYLSSHRINNDCIADRYIAILEMMDTFIRRSLYGLITGYLISNMLKEKNISLAQCPQNAGFAQFRSLMYYNLGEAERALNFSFSML